MISVNATEARKEWSLVLDNAIHVKPQIIKRTRDYMLLSDVRFIEDLLSAYKFTADVMNEDDGSVTLSLHELDIVENGVDLVQAKSNLASAILDYANDFYGDFNYWSTAPNRKSHIPYVFKALMLDDTEKIGELIECQSGKI